MGSGRDKRKRVKGKQPGAGAEKTAKKTEKNTVKAERRATKKTEGSEDDIDALLAAFKLQEQARTKVEVMDNTEPPSARVHASFTTLPQSQHRKEGHILMFGGEYDDLAKDKFYTFADLFLYSTTHNRWSKIVSPTQPLPRSAHQAVVLKGYLYVFGGEMTSLNQENFRHYRDLWRLDLESLQWEQLPTKGGPSARSGHRMVANDSKLVLFGGFYNADKQLRYYNDLWEFDTEGLAWTCLDKLGRTSPPPRGGSQMVVHGGRAFLYGGHSVELVPSDGSETDTVHTDLWCLDLGTHVWERLKPAGILPSLRLSFGMVAHRDRAILFGGITDQHGQGHRMYSELHNDMFQFSFPRQRWYPVVLRAPRAPAGKAAAVAAAAPATIGSTAPGGVDAPAPSTSGAADAAEHIQGAEEASAVMRPDMEQYLKAGGLDKSSAIYRAAVRIQSRYRGYVIRKAFKTYKLGGSVSELLYSPATYGIDFSARDIPGPRARHSSLLAVCGNTLWLYGGVVEIAYKDVTLDDVWSLDLVKLDGWKCVKENSAGEEAFKEGLDWESADEADEEETEG